jgi:nucleoside-diphosphate-sugar epimerase
MLPKIILTGASGFVGTNLTQSLSSQFDFRPIVARYKPQQVFFWDAYAIVHLAGKAHDLKNVSTPEDYYEANTELTKQLFDAFLTSEATVFLYISSVKAAADIVPTILTETDPPNPVTHYGKSKLLAEAYIFSKEIPANKRVYVLRPCMMHGKGNKGNLNLLFGIVKKGIPYPLGSFDNKRSFLSIDNMSFAVKEFMTRTDIPTGIYNIADDLPVSTNRLIELMAEVMGKKSNILLINKRFITILAKIGDTLRLPLNTERLGKLTENYIVDNTKLVKAIGKKLPLNAEQGLKQTLNYFKNKQ